MDDRTRTRPLDPCEVVVNDVRYVREETMFAAMREVVPRADFDAIFIGATTCF